jgi:hypothetical protein
VKKRGVGHLGKAYEEILAGDDLHRASGEWRQRYRLIDRDGNWYDEVVTDSEGQVVHECHEPLTDHEGHGAARTRTRSDDGS